MSILDASSANRIMKKIFRKENSLNATRPIVHKLDETIRGHVSCSWTVLKTSQIGSISDFIGVDKSYPLDVGRLAEQHSR